MIGSQVTAVCVVEPDAVVALSVDTHENSVQTAVSYDLETEQDLIGWLADVSNRDGWQPDGLVMLGSGDELDIIARQLEQVLGIPVFAPAEAELALARGAALASVNSFGSVRRSAVHRPRTGARRHPVAGPKRAGGDADRRSADLRGVRLGRRRDRPAARPRPDARRAASGGRHRPDLRPATGERSVAPAPPPQAVAPPPEQPALPAPPEAVSEPAPEVAMTEEPAPEVPADVPADPPAAAPVEAAAPPPMVTDPTVPPVSTAKPSLRTRIMERLADLRTGGGNG